MDILYVAVAFLLGSVPFGQILLRGQGLDLRLIGSGNVGATNVLRVASGRLALAVFTLDAAKGAAAVWLTHVLTAHPFLPVVAGLAAIAGHIYPPWLGFRGGKGMATTAGVALVLAPWATAGATAVFVAIVWWTRFVSLGSLGAMVMLPPLALATRVPIPVVWAITAAVALVAFRHRSNIRRLLDGTERRLGQKVKVS